MKWLFICFSFVANMVMAAPKVIIAPPKPYSAGPYGFSASKVTINGIHVGEVESGSGPHPFGPQWMVFLACDVTNPTEEMDGDCMQWRMFNLVTNQVSSLNLPHFDPFTATPSFVWPYIAYVDTGGESNTVTRAVFCTVYDYQKHQVLKRIKVTVSEDTFATDYPEMFLAPKINTTGSKHMIRFYLDVVDSPPQLLCTVSLTKQK